jgi:hypothetical protein
MLANGNRQDAKNELPGKEGAFRSKNLRRFILKA